MVPNSYDDPTCVGCGELGRREPEPDLPILLSESAADLQSNRSRY